MNKLFLALALTVAAQAATVSFNCTPFPTTFTGGNGGPNALSCPGFTAPVDQQITSITLNYLADYQFGGSSNSVNFTFAAPAGFVNQITVVNVSGGPSSGAIGSGSAVQSGLTLPSFAAFGVDVSSAVQSGSVATSSAAASVTYEYSPINVVPEPSTMALLGSALVGLGFIARKRK